MRRYHCAIQQSTKASETVKAMSLCRIVHPVCCLLLYFFNESLNNKNDIYLYMYIHAYIYVCVCIGIK